MSAATYSSVRGGSLRTFWGNLWAYHELLSHLVSRNLRVQYKQSILGYAWIVLNPVSQLLTLTFVFTEVFHSPSQSGAPFILFLFCALLPWIFFSNAVLAATESVVSGSNLVTAVYFPREMLVVAAVLGRFVDLLAGLVILAVLFIVSGHPLGIASVWVPPIFIMHLVFVIGLSMPLAALNLFFHDIRYLVGVAIYLWFFFTPIFYPMSAVPERYRQLYELNPNARIVDAYRYALLENVSPPLGSVLAICVLALLSLAIGYYLFKKMEPAFADYV